MSSKAPRKRAYGRSLLDFLDENAQLLPAEQKLLVAAARGEQCLISEDRPAEATPENTVRAAFIRFLSLGGDDENPVADGGFVLVGAWIDEPISLNFCKLSEPLRLRKCYIFRIDAIEADLPRLDLSGSLLMNGVFADGIRVSGDIQFRHGFITKGEVRLLGAYIGGSLDCERGFFRSQKGHSLSCDRVVIKGSAVLRHGFTCFGEVRFPGALIQGDFDCNGGVFKQYEYDSKSFFICSTGVSINCHSAEILGTVFLGKNIKRKEQFFICENIIDLSSVKIGALNDEKQYWPKKGNVVLNGIIIGRFGSIAPTDGYERVDWLLRQYALDITDEFKPQPWEETIRVLREMGYDQDAKIVAIAKQDQLRKAGRYQGLARDMHWLWGAVAGYGYRPIRLLACMTAIWLACAILFAVGAQNGLFAPASPVIHTNPEIRQQCAPDGWTRCALPDEYTTFSPLYYSLDLILPVVDLQQEKDWAPVVTRAGEKIKAGVALRWLMWFEILVGWLGSLLLIAIFTNLIKKD